MTLVVNGRQFLVALAVWRLYDDDELVGWFAVIQQPRAQNGVIVSGWFARHVRLSLVFEFHWFFVVSANCNRHLNSPILIEQKYTDRILL